MTCGTLLRPLLEVGIELEQIGIIAREILTSGKKTTILT